MAERNDKGQFEVGNNIGEATRFKNAQERGGEQAELQRLGGHNAQIVKRQKKTFAALCDMIGVIDANASDRENLRRLGIDPDTADQATQDFVVAAAQYMKAKLGDTKAATWIRDTKGEKVVNVNVTATKTELNFEDIIPKDE